MFAYYKKKICRRKLYFCCRCYIDIVLFTSKLRLNNSIIVLWQFDVHPARKKRQVGKTMYQSYQGDYGNVNLVPMMLRWWLWEKKSIFYVATTSIWELCFPLKMLWSKESYVVLPRLGNVLPPYFNIGVIQDFVSFMKDLIV